MHLYVVELSYDESVIEYVVMAEDLNEAETRVKDAWPDQCNDANSVKAHVVINPFPL